MVFEPAAQKEIAQLEALGFGEMPVCMAKTQYSFSDDATKLGAPRDFQITVRQVKVSGRRRLHRGAHRLHHDHAGLGEGPRRP